MTARGDESEQTEKRAGTEPIETRTRVPRDEETTTVEAFPEDAEISDPNSIISQTRVPRRDTGPGR